MHSAAQVRIMDFKLLDNLIIVAGSVCKDWSSVGLLANMRQCKGLAT